MTCLRTDIYWRDALYNAVSQMPGNVRAAAAYLTERRGKQITAESLRKKLRGLEGESLSMEMAEMLTEWMQELSAGQAIATNWVQSLAGQFGLAVDHVPPPPAEGYPDEHAAIEEKLLHMSRHTGKLAAIYIEGMADKTLCAAEKSQLQAEIRAARTLLHKLERNVTRAPAKRARRA